MKATTAKTAIVTGASSGIGRATAETLARAGFTVFGTSRRVISDGPRQVTMLKGDVTDDDSVKDLVSTVLARTGRIDLLVNNAGIGLIGAAEESAIRQVQALFDVNLFGVMRATNAVLPSMRRQGGGRIINISSMLGVMPAPYQAHYSATKHALEGYSESLDHEVRAFNVRVSLIEPGLTRSVFEQSALEPDAARPEYDQARAGARAFLQENLPAGDSPDVVAAVVLRVAKARKPRRRYAAGKAARFATMMRRLAPAETFDKAVRKGMRLPA